MDRPVKDLMQENERREAGLSQADQALLTDLVVYLRGKPLSMARQEAVRRDLIDMAEGASARGETLAETLGEDPKGLCDEIAAAFPRPSFWQRVRMGLAAILPSVGILAVLWFLPLLAAGLLREGRVPRVYPLTWGQALSLLLILAIAVGVVAYISRTTFVHQLDAPNWVWAAGVLAAMAAVILPTVLLTGTLAALPLPAAVVLVVLPWVLGFLLRER